MWIRFGDALVLAALTIGLSSAAGAVDIVGSTAVTLGWMPASGPVSGYYVIVARDSGASQVESVTIEAQKTLAGAVGETLVVQVAAFGSDGVAGPLSAPSEPINFVASGTPPPDPTPTPTPSPGGTPPPPPPNPDPIAVARDFDGDARADMVVREGTNARVWVMEGAHVASEIPLPLIPSGSVLVGTGDYDGDQNADLLWENAQTGALTLWRLDGGVVVGTGVLDRSSLPSAEEWHVGGSGDLDGDGADDLMLWSRVKGEVEVWTLAGTSVASRTRLTGHAGAWSVVAVDDIDGDGMAEIVWQDELRRALELRDPTAAAGVVLGNVAAGWRGRGGVDLAGDGAAELVLHQPALGTTQAWALDDAGILGASDLPTAKGLGRFSGSGDFDGDGSEDVAWSDAATGVVTLWLASAGATVPISVDRALPAGAEIVSGATGSDDSAFRERFCSGDLDGSGKVNALDFRIFKDCLNQPRTTACNLADMNSDGVVTAADTAIFKLRFTNKRCGAW